MAVTNGASARRLPLADEGALSYEHPMLGVVLRTPGLSLAATSLDRLLTWGLTNSLWMFPMATSCCAIEFMAAAASRVDLDRMGTILRGTPRQTDVMVIAGTITVKMAPRVKKLWEQMPEPKWAIAMGSCAISGDFYRNLYSVVPGVDTIVPVDVYVPGCPPNPEALMHGLLRLQEKVRLRRAGKLAMPEYGKGILDLTRPSVARVGDPLRDAAVDAQQEAAALDATEGEFQASREQSPPQPSSLRAAARIPLCSRRSCETSSASRTFRREKPRSLARSATSPSRAASASRLRPARLCRRDPLPRDDRRQGAARTLRGRVRAPDRRPRVTSGELAARPGDRRARALDRRGVRRARTGRSASSTIS